MRLLIRWGRRQTARRPYPSDLANRKEDANRKEGKLKTRRGTQSLTLSSRRDSQEGAQPNKEKNERTSRSQGEEKKPTRMASSSRSKPTTEERLSAMDEALENLKQMLNYQLDFLQNLDIEAGRRLERLEGDITTTKFEISEELGKLHKELKNPKKEFEDKITQLEEKMAKLNSDWKQGPEK
jgi:chromosome segregation ATPase